MSSVKKPQFLGWLAVSFSTLMACIWAFWGIIENFHEGWYYRSFIHNVGLMLIQFLGPVIIFLALTTLSITYPRLGGILHSLIGIALGAFLFGWNHFAPMVLIIIPLILLGTCYWFGRVEPRHLAYKIAITLPLLTLIVCGIEPAWRISGRIADGNLQERLIEGNGVRLIWAAEGYGWSREGVTWQEAVQHCQCLEQDGKTLSGVPQNIWRLPTVEEAVRSMARHGANSGGVWNQRTGTATYLVRPDKESPLWNPHSPVIYWWTATEIDNDNAYIVVYDGKAWPRRKRFAPGSLGYRCVRTP